MKRKRDGKFVIADVKSGMNAVKYPQSTSIQLAMYAYAPLLAGPLPADGGDTEEFEKMPEKLDLKWGYIIHAPDEHNVEVVRVDIKAGWDIARKAIFPILEWRKIRDLVQSVGTTSIDDLLEPASDERVEWIKGRLAIITMLDGADVAKQLVASRWPDGVPKPKEATPWCENDIDLLDRMLATVEKECSASFTTKDPAHAQMGAA